MERHGGKSVSISLQSHPTQEYFTNFIDEKETNVPSLTSLGFIKTNQQLPSAEINLDTIRSYDKTRNFLVLKVALRVLAYTLGLALFPLENY